MSLLLCRRTNFIYASNYVETTDNDNNSLNNDDDLLQKVTIEISECSLCLLWLRLHKDKKASYSMVRGSIQWTDKKRETKELQQIMEGAREIERLWSIARLPIRLEWSTQITVNICVRPRHMMKSGHISV